MDSSRFSLARAPMRLVMETHSLMATLGVRSSRGSRKANCSALDSSLIILRASRSSWREKGSSSAVVKTLNTVWQKAIPTAPVASSKKAKWKMRFPPKKSASPTAVPMTLKAMWITETRLALRLTPMELMRVVAQVPMFWPMIMGTAMP